MPQKDAESLLNELICLLQSDMMWNFNLPSICSFSCLCYLIIVSGTLSCTLKSHRLFWLQLFNESSIRMCVSCNQKNVTFKMKDQKQRKLHSLGNVAVLKSTVQLKCTYIIQLEQEQYAAEIFGREKDTHTHTLMMAAWRGLAGFMGIFKEQVSDSHRRLLRD